MFSWIFPLSISFLFYKKRINHHNWKGILHIRANWKKNRLKRQDIPYVVIHDPWTTNYYHWITQALPRLLMAQRTIADFILLLPEDHSLEFHRKSLELLGIKSWQTIGSGDQYYKIENLCYPTHDIQVGDYNDDLIEELSQKLSRLSIDGKAVYLFIYRKSQAKRRILNEEDVLKVFLSFGFQIVEFENLSFEQQLILLGKATILAGVHGAGLTNMIFMPGNAKVLELTTKIDGENYYYFTLSNASKHQYYYQLCEAEQSTLIQDANLIVDIEKLKDNIKLMLSVS